MLFTTLHYFDYTDNNKTVKWDMLITFQSRTRKKVFISDKKKVSFDCFLHKVTSKAAFEIIWLRILRGLVKLDSLVNVILSGHINFNAG